jgi:hypothetical protein
LLPCFALIYFQLHYQCTLSEYQLFKALLCMDCLTNSSAWVMRCCTLLWCVLHCSRHKRAGLKGVRSPDKP